MSLPVSATPACTPCATRPRCRFSASRNPLSMTALTLGQRFGVIAILPASIPRHMRAFGAMGVTDRCAGDRALDLGVADLSDPHRTVARMIDVGRTLIETDGADVLIMGCAGMASYRDRIEAALNVPVVEPCQAAAAMALGRIALGWHSEQGNRTCCLMKPPRASLPSPSRRSCPTVRWIWTASTAWSISTSKRARPA